MRAIPVPTDSRTWNASSLSLFFLVLLAHAPLLIWHGHTLWLLPHYQFFPLALAGAAVLGYRCLGAGLSYQPGARPQSLIFWAIAWGVLAFAILLASPLLGAISGLISLLALSYTAGAGLLLRQLLPAWVMLGLLIPLPFDFDSKLMLRLQEWTTRWASTLLDSLGVFHVVRGNTFEVGSQRLVVGEGCSGIHSLFTLIAFVLFFVFWTRRPFLHSLLLTAAAGCWAIVENVARVVLVVLAGARWGTDLATGWQHELLGIGLFVLALGLILSTDRLLLFLEPFLSWRNRLTEDKRTPRSSGVVRRQSASGATQPDVTLGWFALPRGRKALWCLGILYGMLCVSQWTQLRALAFGFRDATRWSTAEPAASLETLPARLGSWRRLSFEHIQRTREHPIAECSDDWHYQYDGRTAIVSLDYAYDEWHPLENCYSGAGWEVDAIETYPNGAATGDLVEWIKVRLHRNGERYALLVYQAADESGLSPPWRGTYGAFTGKGLFARLGNRLGKWQWPWNRSAAWMVIRPVFQIQVLLESYEPLTAQEEQEAVEFFQTVRGPLVEAYTRGKGARK